MSNIIRVTRSNTCYTLLESEYKNLMCNYCKKVLDPLVKNCKSPNTDKCKWSWDVKYYNYYYSFKTLRYSKLH